MNELPMSLTDIIKAREATIADLKAGLENEEGHYVALQTLSNERLTKINQLEAEVAALKQGLTYTKEDCKYWQDNLDKAMKEAEVREAAYLKVIQTLSGRN
jgi:predicted transcriptional regulator